MQELKEMLSGVFVPVVTPFKNDELSLGDLRENLRKLAKTELKGYLALGSNGEFRSLSEREQLEVLEVFAGEKGDKVVMVGAGCESTHETVERTRRVARMGFPFASILTPGYFPKQLDEEALVRFYTRVADESPVPILLYNAPGFTGGVAISARAVDRLAGHENIVGMKDSSSTGPGVILATLDPDHEFYTLAGSANFLYSALHLGATGGVVSLANPLPEACCRLYRLFSEGKFGEALELSHRLVRLNTAISGSLGVAGVKAAMEMTGFRGGEPRHPLRTPTQEERERIRASIVKEGMIDAQ